MSHAQPVYDTSNDSVSMIKLLYSYFY